MGQGEQIKRTDNAFMRQEAYAHRYKTVQPYHRNPGQSLRTCSSCRYARPENPCYHWPRHRIGQDWTGPGPGLDRDRGGGPVFLAETTPMGALGGDGIGVPTLEICVIFHSTHLGAPGSPPNRRDHPRTPTNHPTGPPEPHRPITRPKRACWQPPALP